MEIMTRKQAMFARKNTYFTGVPCKHGHLTYRYVQSGTCQGCIHQNHTLSGMIEERDKRLEFYQQRELIKKVLSEFVKLRMPISIEHVETARTVVYAFAQQHCDDLTIDDVWPEQKPSNGELYRFLCREHDLQVIKETLAPLHSVNIPERPELAQARKAGWKLPKPDMTRKNEPLR